MPNYRMVPGLVTEELDQDILVCDTDLAVVHRVSGPAADVLRQVLATDGAPVGLADDEVAAGLVAAGVLVAADAPEREVGRRSFVRAAAAVGTAGVVTLALPRAAAAASDSESGGGGSGSGAEGDFFVTTGPSDPTSLRFEWEQAGVDSFTYNYSVTLDGVTTTGGPLASGTRHTIASVNQGTVVSYSVTSEGGKTIADTFTV